MKVYTLTYRENNETKTLGEFDSMESLDRLIKAECALIDSESAMYPDDKDRLIDELLVWAKGQYLPNASKALTFTYPDSQTIGRWEITENDPVIKVTFTYKPGPEGPQPEDVSIHVLDAAHMDTVQSLVTYNMGNEGLRSINIEFPDA